MVFERPRRTPHPLNLTPLVDVVFLLLLFFMLTGGLVNRSAADLELPRAGSQAQDKDTAAVITVDREGRVYLDDRAVEPGVLSDLLRARLAETETGEVMIRADRRTDFGPVVRVMDAAAAAGARGVAVAAEAVREPE